MWKAEISFSNSKTCGVFLAFLIQWIYGSLHVKKEFVRLYMDHPRWCNISSVYRYLSITHSTLLWSSIVWEIVWTSSIGHLQGNYNVPDDDDDVFWYNNMNVNRNSVLEVREVNLVTFKKALRSVHKMYKGTVNCRRRKDVIQQLYS